MLCSCRQHNYKTSFVKMVTKPRQSRRARGRLGGMDGCALWLPCPNDLKRCSVVVQKPPRGGASALARRPSALIPRPHKNKKARAEAHAFQHFETLVALTCRGIAV